MSIVLILWGEREIENSILNPGARLYKNSLTERVRVVDVESGKTIFYYNDGFGTTLESVEKLPNGKWNVVLLDHDRLKPD